MKKVNFVDMKVKGILVVLLFITKGLWACDSLQADTPLIFIAPEIMPEFKDGGEIGMFKFIYVIPICLQ